METEDAGGAGATERLDPVEGVVAILSRARMTGTHKLGLLLALLDLAPESVKNARRVSQDSMASRILEIHWTHGRPYGANGVRLRQTSSKKTKNDGSFSDDATVMLEIQKLRTFLRCKGSGGLQNKPLEVIQRELEVVDWHCEWCDRLERSLRKVADDLWRNPVKHLHELSGNSEPFLFVREGRSGIRFLEGVPEVLSRYAAVLRPLIEFRFTEHVVKINRMGDRSPQRDIHAHLFGRDRVMPPDSMKSEMRELQQGQCILTGESLSNGMSVDHLIPWSYHRLSKVENLLVTTKGVNSRKSDSLPGPDPIDRWLKHVVANSQAIGEIAQRHSWPTDLGHVLGVARHIYNAAFPSTGVWNGRQGVRPLGRDDRETVIKKLEWAERAVT